MSLFVDFSALQLILSWRTGKTEKVIKKRMKSESVQTRMGGEKGWLSQSVLGLHLARGNA